MPKLNGKVPKYRLHRARGQAVVTLNQKDHYLGPYDSEESRVAYDRLVAQWLAANRQPIQQNSAPDHVLKISDVILNFWQHAKTYYRRADGTPTSEVDNYRQAIRPLRRLYGKTAALEFGPLALEALRQHMIELGWSRKNINKQIHRVCAIFKWAASRELLPESVYRRLKTLPGLKRGRTTARETAPVRPVPPEQIDAIKPFVSAQIWTMIQLQLLSGPRPEDVVYLQERHINRQSDDLWTAEPEQHKTAWLEHKRIFYFGPRAIALLKPYSEGCEPDDFLFSPAEAEQERLTKLHAKRQTPLSFGNRPGTNKRVKPERHPGNSYDVASYRRAIQRACDQAFPPPPHLRRLKVDVKRHSRWESEAAWEGRLGEKLWQELRAWQKVHRWHPHQLRHNAGTNIRRDFGIEIAQLVLGHRLGSAITEIYAEANVEKAMNAIRQVG